MTHFTSIRLLDMSDPLFMVKTAFYIGNYRQCVKEAQKLQLGDQSLDLECDILMYRAYLAEGLCLAFYLLIVFSPWMFKIVHTHLLWKSFIIRIFKYTSLSYIHTVYFKSCSITAGKYNLVLGEVQSRSGPEFLALVLLAKIMQNPSNKDAIVSEVGNWD